MYPLFLTYKKSGWNYFHYVIKSHIKLPIVSSRVDEWKGWCRRVECFNTPKHSAIPPKITDDVDALAKYLDKNFKKLIIFIRDPKELFIRVDLLYEHTHKKATDHRYVKKTLEKYEGLPTSFGYNLNELVKFIIQFDKFKKDKLIVYYDDLVKNSKETFNTLFSFLNYPSFPENYDLEKVRQESYKSYNYIGGCMTKDDKENFTFHQDKFIQENPNGKQILDDMEKDFINKLGEDLYKKYFGRYIN